MREIHLTSGLQGSGKSTYCRAQVNSFDDVLHLSRNEIRDEIRDDMGTAEYYPIDNVKEHKLWVNACADAIAGNDDIRVFYFDQLSSTNIAIGRFYRSLDAALQKRSIDITNFLFVIDVFDTPLNICLERNAQRSSYAKIPEDVIRATARGRNINSNDIVKLCRAQHPMNTPYIRIQYHYPSKKDIKEQLR